MARSTIKFLRQQEHFTTTIAEWVGGAREAEVGEDGAHDGKCPARKTQVVRALAAN